MQFVTADDMVRSGKNRGDAAWGSSQT